MIFITSNDIEIQSILVLCNINGLVCYRYYVSISMDIFDPQSNDKHNFLEYLKRKDR